MRSIVLGRHDCGVADGSIHLDFDIQVVRDSNDLVGGFADQSSFIQLLAAAQTEGVDFPFIPHRFGTALFERGDERFRLRTLWSQAVLRSVEGIGTPLAILAADPDSSPALPVVRMLEVNEPAWAAWKRRKFEASRRGFEEAKGSWIFGIPASTYNFPTCELLEEIQMHLLETPNEGASWSSGIWTLTEVMNSLNRRISRFLMETGVLQEHTTIAVAANVDWVDLPSDLIDIRRVAWDTGSTIAELPREDSFSADSALPTWETTGASAPVAYTQFPEESLRIQLIRESTSAGTVDLIYVRNPGTVERNCLPMPIPDEWAVYVKYGVLADLFGKEGEGNDPERAAYCESRYEEGVALARLLLSGLDS